MESSKHYNMNNVFKTISNIKLDPPKLSLPENINKNKFNNFHKCTIFDRTNKKLKLN